MIADNEILKPKVSIICIAFNHEKYIRKCLDGIVTQKTSFLFEVIVHDDASTDNTPKIIREYEIKYPKIIKTILQTENQYSKHAGIMKNFCLPKARGTYIAICEGDDYWCSPYKLQKQVEAIENNPDCQYCVHCVSLIKENGEILKESLPTTKLKTGLLAPKDFWRLYYFYGYLFQTSSYLLKLDTYRDFLVKQPNFSKISIAPDLSLQYYIISLGSIYYIDEPMSCYRCFSINSWTSKNYSTPQKQISVYKNKVDTLLDYDNYSKYSHHEFVKKIIDKYNFSIALLQNDYKKCLSPEYAEIFRQFYSLRNRTSIRMRYYFPKIYKIIRFILRLI